MISGCADCMPLWDWRLVYETSLTVPALSFAPSVEIARVDAKISTGLGNVSAVIMVLKNSKLSCDLTLILAHKNLLDPKNESLMETSRKYRYIYRLPRVRTC